MEKTFDLNSREQQVLAVAELEHLRLAARYGQLRFEQDELQRRMAESSERQRCYIHNALANRGVEQYQTARVEQGRVIYTVTGQESPPIAAAAVTGNGYQIDRE